MEINPKIYKRVDQVLAMNYPQEVKDRVLELKKTGLAHRYIAYQMSREKPLSCGGPKRPRNFNDVDIARIVEQLEKEGKLPVGRASLFHRKVRSLPRRQKVNSK
jgi:hypothetical protein